MLCYKSVDRSNNPTVVLGAHRLQSSEAEQVTIQGRRVIIHSGWDSSTLRNDIALIELSQNAPINCEF